MPRAVQVGSVPAPAGAAAVSDSPPLGESPLPPPLSPSIPGRRTPISTRAAVATVVVDTGAPAIEKVGGTLPGLAPAVVVDTVTAPTLPSRKPESRRPLRASIVMDDGTEFWADVVVDGSDHCVVTVPCAIMPLGGLFTTTEVSGNNLTGKVLDLKLEPQSSADSSSCVIVALIGELKGLESFLFPSNSQLTIKFDNSDSMLPVIWGDSPPQLRYVLPNVPIGQRGVVRVGNRQRVNSIVHSISGQLEGQSFMLLITFMPVPAAQTNFNPFAPPVAKPAPVVAQSRPTPAKPLVAASAVASVASALPLPPPSESWFLWIGDPPAAKQFPLDEIILLIQEGKIRAETKVQQAKADGTGAGTWFPLGFSKLRPLLSKHAPPPAAPVSGVAANAPPITVQCPTCNETNISTAKFCSHCGAVIANTSSVAAIAPTVPPPVAAAIQQPAPAAQQGVPPEHAKYAPPAPAAATSSIASNPAPTLPTPLHAKCTECGADTPPSGRMCTECGELLPLRQ